MRPTVPCHHARRPPISVAVDEHTEALLARARHSVYGTEVARILASDAETTAAELVRFAALSGRCVRLRGDNHG